jgi:hypothetical protein
MARLWLAGINIRKNKSYHVGFAQMKNLLTKAFQGITSSLQLLGNMISHQLSNTASSMHGCQ